MNDPQPDADLRERFQRLRAEDRAAAPDLAVLMARVRERDASSEPLLPDAEDRRFGGWRGRSALVWAGGSLAAAAAVAALLLFNPGARADRAFVRTVRSFAESTQWRSPTDVLLDLPGAEITKSVPRIWTSNEPGAGGASRRLRS